MDKGMAFYQAWYPILNSNLQAKTKNISQSESNDIESLINLIILIQRAKQRDL